MYGEWRILASTFVNFRKCLSLYTYVFSVSYINVSAPISLCILSFVKEIEGS